MGGLAFASGPNPVFTPRMSPDVYRAVRDRCQEVLRKLFVVVATPIEGPAKTSFGDIDLFVAWNRHDIFPSLKPAPFGTSPESRKEAIYRALGAFCHKSENPQTLTMAIRWPKDLPSPDAEPKIGLIAAKGDKSRTEKKREEDDILVGIQVDVHVCETLDYLLWMLFKHAHGDLWNLLGSTIRPFGLTIDEVGLYIRIPEIEAFDKKVAKVLLSTDPEEILHFLGLRFDDKQWEEPFASEIDIYEYAATCRLFWVSVDDEPDKASNPEAKSGDEVVADKRKLKSNDRRRMAMRPLFRKWIEEFLPACRASGRFPSTPLARDEVRQQAFEYFPGVQPIYHARLAGWRIERQAQTLWKAVIKPAVPADIDPIQRSCLTSALKKIIMHGDATFDGIVAPPTLKDRDGIFDVTAVHDWVVDMWPKVLSVAWRINQERYSLNQEYKAATKRTGSGEEKPANGGNHAEEGREGNEDLTRLDLSELCVLEFVGSVGLFYVCSHGVAGTVGWLMASVASFCTTNLGSRGGDIRWYDRALLE
ncbi:hypothetical protein F5Y09DRAFT_128172 [Xylaria sp. FL1042]|nr:hypothetical protein F5Y09DRAFT_128172 [Xylaria sp. FL1042]